MRLGIITGPAEKVLMGHLADPCVGKRNGRGKTQRMECDIYRPVTRAINVDEARMGDDGLKGGAFSDLHAFQAAEEGHQ